MKNLFKLIGIIVLGLFLNGCGTYYIASDYSDPIYDENYIPVDTIDSEEELERKWRFDYQFQNNYYDYLVYQDYSFFSDIYWRNRMWRWGWTSSFDFYTNWQWSWGNGYNNYWSPWNQYPWYGNWSSSYWYWHQWNNPWQYSYVYGPRTSWLGNVYAGRYSNRNRFVYSNSNRSSLFSVSDGRTSDSRTYLPNNNSSVISNSINNRPNKPRVVNNKPVIIRWNNNSNSNTNSNSKPSNSSSRPIWNKPSTNTKPNYNWNSSRPSNNNYNRPSNNSNYSRPSAPTNTTKPNRSGRNPR